MDSEAGGSDPAKEPEAWLAESLLPSLVAGETTGLWVASIGELAEMRSGFNVITSASAERISFASSLSGADAIASVGGPIVLAREMPGVESITAESKTVPLRMNASPGHGDDVWRTADWAWSQKTISIARGEKPIFRHFFVFARTMLDPMSLRPRILGLDLGDSRTGVALSDPLGIAHPLLTMGVSTDRVRVKNIGRLVRKHEVVAIVAGNPLHLSGDVSPQAAKVQAFTATLQDALQIPVHLQDERLSSSAAHEFMDRLGLSRGPDRKAKLDQYAAVVILQDWLDGQDRAATAGRLAASKSRSL